MLSWLRLGLRHRIKISNRRSTQRCNVSSFFYAKICSLLARRRSSQPVQRVYWPENVIDWLGKWRPTCVMRHARGQKLQSFRRKWPFCMDLYSMVKVRMAQSLEQAPFTSEKVGSILATDSGAKSRSTLYRNSWVFSGSSGFLRQGKLTG